MLRYLGLESYCFFLNQNFTETRVDRRKKEPSAPVSAGYRRSCGSRLNVVGGNI